VRECDIALLAFGRIDAVAIADALEALPRRQIADGRVTEAVAVLEAAYALPRSDVANRRSAGAVHLRGARNACMAPGLAGGLARWPAIEVGDALHAALDARVACGLRRRAIVRSPADVTRFHAREDHMRAHEPRATGFLAQRGVPGRPAAPVFTIGSQDGIQTGRRGLGRARDVRGTSVGGPGRRVPR